MLYAKPKNVGVNRPTLSIGTCRSITFMQDHTPISKEKAYDSMPEMHRKARTQIVDKVISFCVILGKMEPVSPFLSDLFHNYMINNMGGLIIVVKANTN
jgi:hypothetical protein